MGVTSYRTTPFTRAELWNKVGKGEGSKFVSGNFAVNYEDIEGKEHEDLLDFYTETFAYSTLVQSPEARPVDVLSDGRLVLEISGDVSEILDEE